MILVDVEAVELGMQKLSLWTHIEASQKIRNLILHQAAAARRRDAEYAVDLASLIVERLFPLLRDNMLALASE
jgi:hypothetical protein